MESGGANAELGRGRPEPGRLGRTIGIVLFWLLLCYVIGMSARSIIPSLFWPALAPRPAAPRLEQCEREIRELDRVLLDKAAETLRGQNAEELARWLHAWDERYLAIAGGCGPLEGARKDLQKLRARVESLLRTYQGRALGIQVRIRRALDEVSRLQGSE